MKKFFTYNQIHENVKKMARRIMESPFTPDLMIAIGTGGFIPARMLKTFLKIPILTVGIAYYDLQDNPQDHPIITQWLDNPKEQVKGRRILLVDEVDDSRATIAYCLDELYKHGPKEIAVTVLHNKKKPKAREMPSQVKYIFNGLEMDDDWICYPWDALDIQRQDSFTS